MWSTTQASRSAWHSALQVESVKRRVRCEIGNKRASVHVRGKISILHRASGAKLSAGPSSLSSQSVPIGLDWRSPFLSKSWRKQ